MKREKSYLSPEKEPETRFLQMLRSNFFEPPFVLRQIHHLFHTGDKCQHKFLVFDVGVFYMKSTQFRPDRFLFILFFFFLQLFFIAFDQRYYPKLNLTNNKKKFLYKFINYLSIEMD